ncbi:MAG: ATP-binding cassette domain-containing protein [Actinobacteria bacterium]|nr:ATP-binding cassette domain-containing protein [Actinomycetota bacterium]
MITFSSVSLIYPSSTKTVFENLTFKVSEGELVLVMGPTGSGKSSLLRLINGLIPHHTGGILAGDISVNGISTREVKPGGLAHLIGIVGQNPINGFVSDKVEEELAFGMETLNLQPEVMRKRVEEVLDLLSLAHLRGRSITTLSGGEQQRVAIGSALVMHPKVLVLDEPTSALDPIAAEEVLSILHRLVHDLGLTVVVSEHKLERVIQFADRILYIKGDGQTQIGRPEEVLKDSEIAPPIVHLARALNLDEIALTVRDMRRTTEKFRSNAVVAKVKTPPIFTAEIIEVNDVTLSYGNTRALDNVSLRIGEEEIVAVMGRNGAGKSSLLRSIAGVLKPTQGKISVLGSDPIDLAGKERRQRIGFIPQEPSDLLYGQSVQEECRTADRDNESESGATFDLLQNLVPGISPTTHPRDLSEGQRLALALSVVLSANPKVLILDEPTRGLDYSAKNGLISTLKAIASHGCAVILATHDVELVAEVATRVIFIADGEIVADGSTLDVLLSSPAFAPQVAKIMSPVPWLTVKEVVRAIGLSS